VGPGIPREQGTFDDPDYVDKRVDKCKGGLVKICEFLLKDIRLTG